MNGFDATAACATGYEDLDGNLATAACSTSGPYTITGGCEIKIGGVPGPATATQPYTFTPVVDVVGGTLTFSIANRPAWLVFDSATGGLTGTPSISDVKATGIKITVTDQAGSSADLLFDITVGAPPGGGGGIGGPGGIGGGGIGGSPSGLVVPAYGVNVASTGAPAIEGP